MMETQLDPGRNVALIDRSAGIIVTAAPGTGCAS